MTEQDTDGAFASRPRYDWITDPEHSGDVARIGPIEL